MAPIIAPYGAWKSPITSELVAAGSVGLAAARQDGDDLYWLEMRPLEQGRYVLVRRGVDGQIEDAVGPTFNVRTRVHEYGGAAYAVRDGDVVFCNFADQRLYYQPRGMDPVPLTPEGMRYADMVFDPAHRRIIAVREDHTNAEIEPVNTIVTIDLTDGGPGDVLAGGHDFYAAPRVNDVGDQLAWLSWDHPHMPWTTTELWMADMSPDGSPVDARLIAGGDEESICQPSWSPDGMLYFISDSTNWWNLYRFDGGEIVAIYPLEAEFGKPGWTFGISTYDFVSADQLLCSYTQNGLWHLAEIDLESAQLTTYDLAFTAISSVHAGRLGATFIGGSATEANSVIRLELATMEVDRVITASSVDVATGYLSQPEAIEFPSRHGTSAYAIYYPPQNRDYVAPSGLMPPLLVFSHGGPTGATSSSFNLQIQYWTSRGIAVVDVNYGGSTGYGREYRMRLNGTWGIVDVDDCVDAARSLVERGLADESRLMIRGGSAGGYTTLAALTFENVFSAGASYYGVSDLGALAGETHKFESRYLDNLIGPYPQCKELYDERSPLMHAAGLSCPVIFFQGLEDKIVLPNQAELMVDVLREKGVPVAYLAFAGEQHGFRQAKNIMRTLDSELAFYSRVLDFELATPAEPVEIANL